MRVLVTGSRNWTDRVKVRSQLGYYWLTSDPLLGRRHLTVVHGACRSGADLFVHDWCTEMAGYDVVEEPYPADWSVGKRAGPERNRRMVALGADVCLCFVKDSSRGASGCADLAEKAGIPTMRFTS